MFLLIHDLGQPTRFWRLLLAPNTKSWLVKGGWILGGFGAVTTASLVARWLGKDDVADALRWVNVPLAVMTSGYSAFLFAQCKGRDEWLDPDLFLAGPARPDVRSGSFSRTPGFPIVASRGLDVDLVFAGVTAVNLQSERRWIEAGQAHLMTPTPTPRPVRRTGRPRSSAPAAEKWDDWVE
jgi:hypothetical protein